MRDIRNLDEEQIAEALKTYLKQCIMLHSISFWQWRLTNKSIISNLEKLKNLETELKEKIT